MSDSGSFSAISIRETRELLYTYPPRLSARIEIGDWQRWVRIIRNIPKPRAIHRDIASASVGISIESLFSAIATVPRWSNLPTYVSVVYTVICVFTLAVGLTCFYFSREIDKFASHRVEEVLQDMNDVWERSVRAEEKIIPTDDDVKDSAS